MTIMEIIAHIIIRTLLAIIGIIMMWFCVSIIPNLIGVVLAVIILCFAFFSWRTE